MAKVRPIRCPVSGCTKRGTIGSLRQHAEAMHRNIDPIAYAQAIEHDVLLQAANSPDGFVIIDHGSRKWPLWAKIAVGGLSAAVLFALLVLWLVPSTG